MALDIAALGPSVLAPSGRRAEALKPGSHFVQLYDDDSSLISAVKTFFATGLVAGDAAICIASEAHLRDIEVALARAGQDIDSARRDDVYIPVNAEEALNSVIEDGVPKKALFSTFISDLILRASGESGRHVRIFGEIVALMWAQGNAAGAVRLEELWNELAEVYPFQLFCGYPVRAFDQTQIEKLSEVCGQHTHVLPPG